MNKSLCLSCKKLAPSHREEREGKVFMVKECPDCGTTETLLSSDASRHMGKRGLDPGYDTPACTSIHCNKCNHHRQPTYAFVDVTNRCNLNCPMSADSVPGHGFVFDPPMEHFKKIFDHLATFEIQPTIALFGGEPTVRKDLPEIVKLARSYGFNTRVLTNGINLADKDYCQKMVDSRTHLLVSYDGCKPSTYTELRKKDDVLEKKQRAIENLSSMPRAKVSFVTCLAWGLNDKEMPELLQFYHDHREMLRGVYLMPLVRTWEADEFDYNPPRMTTEDVETLLAGPFPGHKCEFISLGLASHFSAIAKSLGRDALPYHGAHPNCESFYLLISDGEKYVPIDHFLTKSLPLFAGEMLDLEKRIRAREERWKTGAVGKVLGALFLRKLLLKLTARAGILRTVWRNVRVGRFFKGRGLGKVWHALVAPLQLLVGCKSHSVRTRHMTVQEALRIVILPLEDDPILETDRLERCPSAHVAYNPKTDEFKYVPVCSWRFFSKEMLREAAETYAEQDAETEQVAAP